MTWDRRRLLPVVLAACLSAAGFDAEATSIREVSVAELAENSSVIFEATIVAVTARKAGAGRIVTQVVFDVTDVVKGQLPLGRLTLEFLGGHVGDERLAVAAMRYPDVGEKGIYFAEAIDRTLVNPLYGWDQGRFLVEQNTDGSERVLTAARRRVTDVQADEPPFVGMTGGITLSSGTARGIRSAANESAQQALTKGEFKRRIRNLLGGAP